PPLCATPISSTSLSLSQRHSTFSPKLPATHRSTHSSPTPAARSCLSPRLPPSFIPAIPAPFSSLATQWPARNSPASPTPTPIFFVAPHMLLSANLPIPWPLNLPIPH